MIDSFRKMRNKKLFNMPINFEEWILFQSWNVRMEIEMSMQFETTDTLSDYVRWTTDSTKFLKNISEIGEFK